MGLICRSDIEGEIYDLTRASRLAQMQLHATIGELEHDPRTGKCIEAPDAENIAVMIFALNQVSDLAEKIEAHFGV